MPSASFPPSARLHRPSEFAAALAGRRIGRGVLFAVTAKSNSAPNVAFNGDDSSSPMARLGLIMAKRHAKLATTRNALKRAIRESFRHQRLSLPAADYVFRLHRKIDECSLRALKNMARQEADAHFAKISASPRVAK